jgi:hypothetical protein
MSDRQKQLSWKVVRYGTGALATMVAQRSITVLWRRVTSTPPPDNAADRDVTMTRALTWAIATGIGIGVMRLLAVRSAARTWEAATHETPPDVT